MEPTNVDRALAALEEKHADDPERALCLRRTRQFKASWLELAEALSDVKRGKKWAAWGFESFEAYSKSELKLRADTVEKLTGSFMFLHKSAPEVLKRDPLDVQIPSYHAIDFLRRAEEKAATDDTVSEATITDIRKKVLDEGVPIATVSRLYKDSLFPVGAEEKKDKDRQALKSTATKLRDLLEETKLVAKPLAKSVSSALEELLTELALDAKAA